MKALKTNIQGIDHDLGNRGVSVADACNLNAARGTRVSAERALLIGITLLRATGWS
jgi:hypothetical protein